MPNAAIGALMLVAFGVFYYLSIFATVRAVLAFTGTILVGSSGHVVHWLTVIVTWLAHFGDTATGWALGVGVPAALTLVVGIVFIYDLHPRNSAGKRTGWAGIVLAAMIVAGVTGIATLNHVSGSVQTAVTSVRNGG
jgi:uncharacterized BrkB/YihY/UPF0761 family membrane protein